MEDLMEMYMKGEIPAEAVLELTNGKEEGHDDQQASDSGDSEPE